MRCLVAFAIAALLASQASSAFASARSQTTLPAIVAAVNPTPPPTPAATATRSAPSGPAAPADGTYNYTITKGSDAIGKSSVTIKRTDIGLTIHEAETLTGGFSFVIDEIVEVATLAPKAYTGSYSKGSDAQTTVRAAFDRNGATVTIDGVPGTAPLPNPQGIKNAYVLEGSLVTGFAMLPAQLRASKAGQFSLIAPREVLQFVGRVDARAVASRPSGVPAGDVVLSVSAPVNFDEWYDPATFVLHTVSIPSQQVLITLTK